MAESREVLALRQYVLDSGLPHRVTSTYRPGAGSRHGAQGTAGNGLAVDFAGPVPDPDGSPEMLAIAKSFLAVSSQLFELIYTPIGFSIKRGQRVSLIDPANHYNHVHTAVDRGVFVKYKGIEVKPMFDPAECFAYIRTDPVNGGWIALKPDGAIFNGDGSVFYGGMNGSPHFVGRQAAKIIFPGDSDWPNDGAAYKYRIVATSGEVYGLPR